MTEAAVSDTLERKKSSEKKAMHFPVHLVTPRVKKAVLEKLCTFVEKANGELVELESRMGLFRRNIWMVCRRV